MTSRYSICARFRVFHRDDKNYRNVENPIHPESSEIWTVAVRCFHGLWERNKHVFFFYVPMKTCKTFVKIFILPVKRTSFLFGRNIVTYYPDSHILLTKQNAITLRRRVGINRVRKPITITVILWRCRKKCPRITPLRFFFIFSFHKAFIYTRGSLQNTYSAPLCPSK